MSRKQTGRIMSLVVVLVGIVFSSSGVFSSDLKVDMVSVYGAKMPVMLQFGKSWCPRCKSTKPILDSVAKTCAGKVLIVPVDVEVNKDIVKEFSVRLIPTQIFLFPDKTQFFRHEGILQEQQIVDIFKKMGVN